MVGTGGHMFNLVAELAVCSAVCIWSCTLSQYVYYYDAIQFLVNIEDDLMYLAYRCPE